MKKIVIALGGNALEDGKNPTAENQLEVIKSTVKSIVNLIEDGYNVIITHGNGPQVGRILIQNELAKEKTPPMPFDVCGAMSQGMIGYHVEQALRNELKARGLNSNVVALVTQVLVNKDDEAFMSPTKPIGPFYDKDTANALSKANEYIMREDSGRGFRRVVASPKPVEIVELSAIKTLIDSNFITIACGGGGVPVIKNSDDSIEGIAAVIDKDFASAKLAEDIDADLLVILTAIDKVALNYNKPNQILLDKIDSKNLEKYIEEGHFAPGSMLPKIEASLSFVKSKLGRKAIITSLSKLKESLEGTDGTLIV